MVPSKAKFVTYYRVSTQKQGQSGLGLEAQKSAVKEYIKAHGGVELATFTEVESGKINARPQLEAALLRCRQAHATLLVAKLDRLSRNAAFLFNLRESGVKFQALDIPEANTLTLGVMFVLAQHEREIISARTRVALAARRARGLPLGTPRDMSPYAARASALASAKNTEKAKRRAAEVVPAIKAARSDGCRTLRQIAERLDELGIPTPRGKKWTATAVANAERLIAVTKNRSSE
jgi:DNA invertase Pin-like site-specific DNA recombinase